MIRSTFNIEELPRPIYEYYYSSKITIKTITFVDNAKIVVYKQHPEEGETPLDTWYLSEGVWIIVPDEP